MSPLDILVSRLPDGAVRTDTEMLRERAIDSWALALLRRVRGDELPVPAPVVFPASTEEVATVLTWASQTFTAVIPAGAAPACAAGRRFFRMMPFMSESSPATLPVTTALGLPGMAIERDLGLTFGLVVRSMGFAKSFGAGLTALRQGEVPQYTSLLEDSRRHAIDRMIDNARLLGANAIVAMRFDSSEISQQLTEIVAYGTAVVVRPTG